MRNKYMQCYSLNKGNGLLVGQEIDITITKCPSIYQRSFRHCSTAATHCGHDMAKLGTNSRTAFYSIPFCLYKSVMMQN